MESSGPDGATNVPEYVFSRIQEYGDEVAQIDASTGESVSYREIWLDVQRTGQWLRKQGVDRTTIVGICMENCLDYAPLLLGVLHAGATAALYPPAATPSELEHLISISKPSVIFAPNLSREQKEAVSKTPEVRLLLYKRAELENISESGEPVELCPADLDSCALLLPSSGSTGLPKEVIIKHTNLLWALSTTSGLLMERKKPALGLMPFYHAYGLGLMLMALCQGAPLIVMNKFNIKNFSTALVKYKISHLHIVASLLVRIADNEISSKALRYITKIFTGATSVSPKVQALVLDKLEPGARLYHSYGMTETTHIVAFGEVRADKPGSPGMILPCMKAKIVDEDGSTLGPCMSGELCVQGPLMTSGYYNNPKATEETFTSDRWLKTGDLASIDDNGYLFILDRIKDIIKFQGFQVSVTELELVITKHPGVKEVAVIAVHHDKYGEVPRAFIVRDNKSKITEEQIHQHVSKELSHYKWLRGGVRFLESLPKMQSMKINRKLLRGMQ